MEIIERKCITAFVLEEDARNTFHSKRIMVAVGGQVAAMNERLK